LTTSSSIPENRIWKFRILRYNLRRTRRIVKSEGDIMKLQVVIEQDETGYYVAEVPALPGCVSQGQTMNEAKANIKEAITGWLAVMNEKTKRRQAQIIEITV